jgi:hypothetical protein
MRIRIIILTIVTALAIIFGQVYANPFACKTGKQTARKKVVKPTENIAFMGYAIMKKQRFAIIHIKKREHLLRKGEVVEGIKVIRFSSESLVYQQNNSIRIIPINRDLP